MKHIQHFIEHVLEMAGLSLAILLIYWIALIALARLVKRFQSRQDLVAQCFVRSSPFLKVFCHLMMVSLLVQIFIGDFGEFLPFHTKNIIQVSLIGIITGILFVSVGAMEEHFIMQQSSKFDVTAVQTFTKLARFSLMVIAVLVLLPAMGIETSGILTLGAASSVVLGLASRDWLSNFFGGVMIFVDKPFGVGDWIKCSEKGIEGFVVSIGWRLTCIRTFERRPLYVPNSFFAQTPIENPSRMENRRIKHSIHLPYKDSKKIPIILDHIRAMLRSSPDVDQTKPIFVHVTQLASSAVECLVYCFTTYTDWERFLQTQQNVMLGILKIIEEHGATYGIPVSQVLIEHIES
ncbi:MAG: mechanosensitive ion channel family protein [Gammaproteobacteria bacterium]|nr:mechanosensitive ion channel family protein [Gammaproteobacteria bacterium]